MFFFDFFCVSYFDYCFSKSPMNFLFHRRTLLQVEAELETNYLFACLYTTSRTEQVGGLVGVNRQVTPSKRGTLHRANSWKAFGRHPSKRKSSDTSRVTSATPMYKRFPRF